MSVFGSEVLPNGRIDNEAAGVILEVRVSFEPDTLNVAEHGIKAAADMGSVDFDYVLPNIALNDATTALEYFDGGQASLVVASAKNAASFVDFSDGYGRKDPSITFSYSSVDRWRTMFGGKRARAVEIVARCHRAGVAVGDLHRVWQQLVDRYKDMPPKRFKGAQRL